MAIAKALPRTDKTIRAPSTKNRRRRPHELDPPQAFSTVAEIKRFFNALDRGRLIVPKPIDALATMPSQEPDRSAEAVRRVLPELRKLERYERRAAARRDRGVLHFFDRIALVATYSCHSAKRTQLFPIYPINCENGARIISGKVANGRRLH